MSWISRNIETIISIISLGWKNYLEVGGYDNTKYPEEVYSRLLSPVEIDENWIRESLIWKYGKWPQWIQGKSIPRQQIATIDRFVEARDILASLLSRREPGVSQAILGSFPEVSSIFLCHLMFPSYWAIMDQHTARFLHWIHLQIENYDTVGTTPWGISGELNELESELAHELDTTNRELDRFMMTYGRKLKHDADTSNFKNGRRSLVNKLHFKEIDWVLYFPSKGNKGRALVNYGVAYRDRVNKKSQPGPKINLRDVTKMAMIHDHCPHTVGLFEDASGRGSDWTPAYIETRLVHSNEELLEWIAEIEED